MREVGPPALNDIVSRTVSAVSFHTTFERYEYSALRPTN